MVGDGLRSGRVSESRLLFFPANGKLTMLPPCEFGFNRGELGLATSVDVLALGRPAMDPALEVGRDCATPA